VDVLESLVYNIVLRKVLIGILFLALLSVSAAADTGGTCPTIGPGCCPDVDGNGFVSFLDFSAVASAYGKPVGHVRYNPNADIDRDGDVDKDDSDVVRANIGATLDCATNTCGDRSPRTFCSPNRPRLCNPGLQLVNRCQGPDNIFGNPNDCGCPSGVTLTQSGRLVRLRIKRLKKGTTFVCFTNYGSALTSLNVTGLANDGVDVPINTTNSDNATTFTAANAASGWWRYE